ncbi:glutamate-5-semialdehyde dehydrogenase [Corynebacterium poyangense]|uniref:Gamma-glutamyl phosphate reductase n=1 Tax=Corynebacterium poyangense TaxID=2684405 RepID=A0A7H0SQF5_9CORY|nr:glutamate-5-semialdehyde dehydrogenase [Corynebacterium poyangense]MBZ8178335.1 glutamate-5-semialdehyde dehydrogenase [Corynebacterium poyangense]QNQ90780.1 glutamate-5-semialdehyde dehydrogenase [Corynebacterium poyangense]
MTSVEHTNRQREEVLRKARRAKELAPIVAALHSDEKNQILRDAAQALEGPRQEEVLAANRQDVAAGQEAGLSEALLDRLSLDSARLSGMAAGLRQVAALKDPVGDVVTGSVMPNGIRMRKVRVPLGVLGIVYEARPNVTVDAFGLALKSGNVALLRGSQSARHSNSALVTILQDVAEQHGIAREIVQLLPCDSHDSVRDLITARGLVDVVIPRGSARLIDAVVSEATVPSIETGAGNCHFYIDATADIDQAIALVINGKTRRPSVCNATETVLVDRAISPENQLKIIAALQEAGVKIHGEDELRELGADNIIPATEEDWGTEYLSLDISFRLVSGVEEAISHISRYSTGHTEGIATLDTRIAQRFSAAVDSAAVMINASTAFTDGEEYGMGAEIGISTQKLHARGPLALPELTSTKWILEGEGQTRP